jgi:hypothetical protein
VRRALAVALVAAVQLLGPAVAAAQEGPSATSSTVAELPPAEMIPRPNSGHAPTEAGDRGGGLQLLVFGLVLVAIGGGVAKVVHDSRRARRAAGS